MRVPLRLRTERLTLRPFREDDVPDLHAYYGDPCATAFTTRKAFTHDETWRVVATMLGHWELRGYGPYAVEERASGQIVGTVGFWYPSDWPGPEIKWALARAHWGNGYAREAARAVQAAGREHLPHTPLISLVHVANHRSQAVARAVGATVERRIRFRDEPCLVFRHPGWERR